MTNIATQTPPSSSCAAAKDALNVAYYTPGWPAGLVPNGIVSYVGNVLEGLRSQDGVRGWVVSRKLVGEAPAGENVVLLEPPPRRSMLGRLCGAMSRPSDAELNARQAASQIAAAVARLAGRTSLDLLEMEESYGFAGKVIPKVQVPVVVRLHGPWFLNGPALGAAQDERFRERDRLERPGIEYAAVVTGVSKQVLRATREHYGLELPSAEVIYNPVPPCPPPNRWSAQLCEPDHILFVGRFDRHKGGDTVIDAFARIAARHPTARLSFAGPDRGCPDDAGKRWLLPEYVSAKLPDPRARARFEWLNVQTHEQIANLRQRAAVTVVASRYETFGIAAVEAMAASCPLVSTDAGGLAEIVSDGVNALVARAGNADDLAGKVLSLLEHRDRAAALGERAVRDAARFHPDVIAAQSVALYRRTVEQFKRTGRGPSVGRQP
ncbi:MAG TPA: glycosyltransferase family 4 protein [Tepidisphaeraceae bacterium]|nr:glycosyltransferase family 4 protein [Tepidisphaeraceae bacterium]